MVISTIHAACQVLMTCFNLKQPGCAELAQLAETLRELPSFLAGQTGCMRLVTYDS